MRSIQFTFRALALALSLGLGAACTSSGKSEGQLRIETLTEDIEKLQRELQRCRADVVRSLVSHDSLVTLAEGDLLQRYREFNLELRSGEEGAARIERLLLDVNGSAEAYFAVWESTLETIQNERLRKQSAKRLETTRERVGDVIDRGQAARDSLLPLLAAMRDHATFLGNDLNSESIAILSDEKRKLQERAKDFYGLVDQSLEAAKEFKGTVAMHIPGAPAGTDRK